MLFPNGENLSREAWQEVLELFHGEGRAEKMTGEEVDNRLFQIYLQLEEMDRYTSDFQDIKAMVGSPQALRSDEDAPLDWSRFDLDDDRDMERILEELRRCDELQATDSHEDDDGEDEDEYGDSDMEETGRSDLEGSSGSDIEGPGSDNAEEVEVTEGFEETEDDDDDDDDEEWSEAKDLRRRRARRAREMAMDDAEERAAAEADKEYDSDGNEIIKEGDDVNKDFLDEQGNLLNLVENKYGDLVDEDGTKWSMIVLNTDTVQKTMPGGRTVSHRALVMLGNMRGAGGFAMGKGKSPDAALTAACR